MPPSCRPRSVAAARPGSLTAGRIARLLLTLAWAARWRLVAVAAVLLPCALLLPHGAAQLHAVLPVLANLLVCWQFGSTLLPGREPLIARYTRFDMGGRLPPECRGYARGLTWVWAGFLGGFAAAHAAALAGLWPSWPVLAAEAVAGSALFLGEHILRGRRFPHHGRATPWRTLRAVRLAHEAGHAG